MPEDGPNQSELAEHGPVRHDTYESKAPPALGVEHEQLSPAPPEKQVPVVSRRELWAYYLYYNGNNGVGPMSYSLTLLQTLLSAAGYDPDQGPLSSCTGKKCVVPWGDGGQTKSVTSVVLIANGLSFAIMTVLFTTFGAAADYRNFGRWLLIVLTVVCWGAQFGSLALTEPGRWPAAMALYILGFVSYGATLVFYAAQFPLIARNTAESRRLADAHKGGLLSWPACEDGQRLERSRVSNISTVHSNIGFLLVSLLNLSVLIPLDKDPMVDSYTITLTTSYWILLGIWYFIFQKPRPGPSLPSRTSFLTIGWKQLFKTFKQARKLPHTFTYLVAYFMLADGLNTTGTLISIIQSNTVQFSFLQNTYIGISQAITSIISTLGFWYIQKHWKLKTKSMFVVTNIVTVLIPLWGMIGLWTSLIGFHHKWEFWAYNVIFGLFQAPYYAYSQTIMAELSPPGQENMFFALFGFSNRASSVIGPNVIQAIIDKTGSNWSGFPFLFAICFLSSLTIWFWVNLDKGREDALRWKHQH